MLQSFNLKVELEKQERFHTSGEKLPQNSLEVGDQMCSVGDLRVTHEKMPLRASRFAGTKSMVEKYSPEEYVYDGLETRLPRDTL